MTDTHRSHSFLRSEYTDHRIYDFENDVDPENHVFNHINDSCRYYSEELLNDSVELDKTLSLIHFNCRSLPKNFIKINEFLDSFKNKFKLIALSETWINEERDIDLHINGYDLHVNNRSNRSGGGVALYIDSNLKYRLVECLTVVIDDLMECIAVEIELERRRNMVVACVYRKPGSNVETFKDSLDDLMKDLNANKSLILCGDFNIDLLKVSTHKQTSDFLDTLYSRGLYPLITKPSRVTSFSATLINHIFTNVLENSINCGLVINDISDHLPVFATFNYELQRKNIENYHRYKRVSTVDRINAFRNYLLKQE